MDSVNSKIIDRLQRDSGTSVSDLAQELGMSTPPCWRRVNSLKKNGVLKEQVWLVEPSAVGVEVFIIANVKLATHDIEATQRFREEVQKVEEIIECYILLGERDVMLKIAVPSIKYYEEMFYKRLSTIPGVREVNSSVVLSEVKRTTRLPIFKLSKK